MSIKVPEKFSKKEFNQLTNYLKDHELTKYIELVKENYKKPKGGTEYFLKNDADTPALINLDYVFNSIRKYPAISSKLSNCFSPILLNT